MIDRSTATTLMHHPGQHMGVAPAAWKSYNLTTVKVDFTEHTCALVRLILRRLKNPDLPAMTETIRTRLVVRGTVA